MRSDAARNDDRILQAAREVYSPAGPGSAVEAIARRAGVGERTLYRRFPSKGQLIRAALEQGIAEMLLPTIVGARSRTDSLKGLVELIEAAISPGAQEHNLLAAARRADVLFADLVAQDLPRIIAMLNSVPWTTDRSDDGWRRYVALVLDGMTTAKGAQTPSGSGGAIFLAPCRLGAVVAETVLLGSGLRVYCCGTNVGSIA